MTPLFKVLAAVLLLVGVAGPAANAAGIEDKIEIMGQLKEVKVVEIQARVRNGLLIVQTEMENLSPKTQQVFYRIKWLEESGLQAWEDEAWKTLVLYGRQRQTLVASAPTPMARDFRVILHTKGKDQQETDPDANPPFKY
jgi:uncharacterized protein YcfL